MTLEAAQSGMDRLDDNWKISNEKLLKLSGVRTYKVTKREAFRAMMIATTNLGMVIDNQDLDTGFMFVKAQAPTPLTNEEWQAVKEIEELNMQAIVEPEVGAFNASMFRLKAQYFSILTNIIMLERAEDLQVSITPQMRFTGANSYGIVYGHQPPPEAVKYALRKIWNEFEKVLFIQERTIN